VDNMWIVGVRSECRQEASKKQGATQNPLREILTPDLGELEQGKLEFEVGHFGIQAVERMLSKRETRFRFSLLFKQSLDLCL
jgi:hypothetical protein